MAENTYRELVHPDSYDVKETRSCIKNDYSNTCWYILLILTYLAELCLLCKLEIFPWATTIALYLIAANGWNKCKLI